jgi:hypothetical protein
MILFLQIAYYLLYTFLTNCSPLIINSQKLDNIKNFQMGDESYALTPAAL